MGQSQNPNPTTPSPELPPRRCVVLVDDEASYLDLLEQLLSEHLACPVHPFARAEDALAAMPGLTVGLIVTDFNMPDVDGLEFLARAHAIAPGVGAVMITGHPVVFTPEQVKIAPNLRAIVRKPFRWPALAAEISRHWPEESRSPFPGAQ